MRRQDTRATVPPFSVDGVRGRTPRRRDAPASLIHQMFYDGAQVACLLIHAELPFGASAFVENRVHVLDGAAAAELVHDIVDEGQQLDSEIAHGHFAFLAEINQLALDAIPRSTP